MMRNKIQQDNQNLDKERESSDVNISQFFRFSRMRAKANWNAQKLTDHDLKELDNAEQFRTMSINSSGKEEGDAFKVSHITNSITAPDILLDDVLLNPKDGTDGKGFHRKIISDMDDERHNDSIEFEAMDIQDDIQHTNKETGTELPRWLNATKKVFLAIVVPELYMDDLLDENNDKNESEYGRYQQISMNDE